MVKKKFISVIVLFLMFVPVMSLAEEEGDKTVLKQQLAAVLDYIDHLLYPTKTEPMSERDLKIAINGGVKWTLASQKASGHFRYEYEPYEGRYSGDDNTVRQAGTLFALSELYRRQTVRDLNLKEKIEQSLKFFSENTVYEEDDIGCLVDLKNVHRCQLGATSLAFIGLLNYLAEEPSDSKKYQKLVLAYGKFILASQKEAGGFRNEYRVGLSFRQGESPFSNGEALLALSRYYLYRPNDEVKNAIEKGYDYLKEQEFDTALYLWIMAALKDMIVIFPQNDYYVYASEFTSWRMDNIYGRYTDRNYCAYAEGLASAYSVLESRVEPTELSRLKEELSWWNAHNFELQIDETDTYKIMPDGNKLTLKSLRESELAQGGFLTAWSEPKQRIDFTQHCISAYLQTLLDVEGGEI
jgi:hypothetical protein